MASFVAWEEAPCGCPTLTSCGHLCILDFSPGTHRSPFPALGCHTRSPWPQKLLPPKKRILPPNTGSSLQPPLCPLTPRDQGPRFPARPRRFPAMLPPLYHRLPHPPSRHGLCGRAGQAGSCHCLIRTRVPLRMGPSPAYTAHQGGVPHLPRSTAQKLGSRDSSPGCSVLSPCIPWPSSPELGSQGHTSPTASAAPDLCQGPCATWGPIWGHRPPAIS